MKILTKSIKERLIKNHQENEKLLNKGLQEKKFNAVVKLFNPTGSGSWYLSELEPDTNIAFGLSNISHKELGYIDLNELQSFKGQFGLGIERDIHFEANKHSLEDCKKI
jgi:hypothetical protein|tara:strand:+ start:342 stop:668 length:327 start_codon:yes stop_codon:yes gene_type:complete